MKTWSCKTNHSEAPKVHEEEAIVPRVEEASPPAAASDKSPASSRSPSPRKMRFLRDIWELVDHPQGKEVTGLTWIYKTKYNEDGSIAKHKAGFVAKGYFQQPGVHYDETFAPVA